MGRGKYMGEIFTLSGILKLLETALLFTALMVHRHGDHGKYVFFGTTTQSLLPTDDGIDVENLGNGVLVTYAIISPILLIAYVLDGIYAIQSLFLEPLWNFVAVFLFAGTGVKTIVTWYYGKSQLIQLNRENYAMSYAAGLGLGALCLTLSVIYAIDFCVSLNARKRLRREPY